ncbi:hypothetical protein D2L64_07055 [Micromonospora radicis]|uniref:Activator of Hsp90 ATPase homologue 1/2-like C-terminal domain-containing protein n=1 Tax=Micromonospora radicis TaxID=1894971 RepID=A0A418MYJ1_9ACTN|nr:hypothetical protein D2L64_07055 [Micromonospora radicis]
MCRREHHPLSGRRRGFAAPPRPGGSGCGPDHDHLFRETQTFLVIERPHRLVTEPVGSSPDGSTMTTRVEVTFEPDGAGTLVTVVQTGFPAVELRDFFTQEVWVDAFARIEAYPRR